MAIRSFILLSDGSIAPVEIPSSANLYRTLHPFKATHDGFDWPARPADYPIDPNYGSFDVYCRLWTKSNSVSDGGAIKLTANQWTAIRQKNNNKLEFIKWAVADTSERIMRWNDNWPQPMFHYPLCFGGNIVNVLETKGSFSRIATWPMGKDVPDNLPSYYWHRCWCVYNSAEDQIRDAPAGVDHKAVPTYMLVLAHAESAWIYNMGLLKV